MPAARSKRGKKSKSAAASVPAPAIIPVPQPVPEVEDTVDDNAMQTDQSEPSNSISSVQIAPADSEKESTSQPIIQEGKSKLTVDAMQINQPEPSNSTSSTQIVHADSEKEAASELTVEAKLDEQTTADDNAMQTDQTESSSSTSLVESTPVESEKEAASKLTIEERKAKLDQLRRKMAASSKANRSSLVEEAAKAKITARDAARLERQRKLAEMLRTKADAEERGEDVERQKNWEYTIEENDEWEKKLARKKRRADFEFHDDAHAARRRYKKDLDLVKPDLVAYKQQKAIAMGQAPGSLAGFNPTGGSSEIAVTSQQQRMAAENLYRDANTLIYGDSKPSEDAIDRVVSKINKDIDKKGKFSRKRLNEEEGDITYINEHNRVFNKKIARYYDKYTAEIRASFERGTAL